MPFVTAIPSIFDDLRKIIALAGKEDILLTLFTATPLLSHRIAGKGILADVSQYFLPFRN